MGDTIKNIDKIKIKIDSMVQLKVSKGKIIHEVALWLLKNFEFRCIIGTSFKDPIYVYKDGIFINKGEIFIANYCEKILEVEADINAINQTIQKIKRLKPFKRNDLGCKNLDLICLNNCVLNIKTKKTFKHNSKYGFMSKIPIDYNILADCTKFQNWLSEVIYESDITTCQEWFGFLLYRRYHEKLALVLIGPKQSGKTVFLNILEKFVGEKNTSAVDFHDIIGNRFSSNNLVNKLLNINDELDATDLKSTVMFKRLLGRSLIPAEAKNQTPYKFINYAKLVFATNKMPLPKIIDDPSSYYDKFITFEFDNTFDKDNLKTNKMLDTELTTNEELSGILNWAIIGFQRLIKNNKFSKCQYWEDVEKIMKRSGNTISAFESQCCEFKEGNLISKDDMFKFYCDFCEVNNKNIEVDLQGFGRNFKPSYVKNKSVGPSQYRGWLNVKVNEGNMLLI
jgi:P4 family phage/plasmid primase-like protien